MPTPLEESSRWTVRITRKAQGPAKVFARAHSLTAGAPVQFDEQYPYFTGLELMLAALGSDLVNGLTAVAESMRVDLDSIEAVVHGQINNPLTYLGVQGAEGHPGLESVTARVFVSAFSPEADVRRAWEAALARSPAVNTLKASVKLNLTLTVS